jgi:RNA polymerase sigma-70 factor (ECF subfamily)
VTKTIPVCSLTIDVTAPIANELSQVAHAEARAFCVRLIGDAHAAEDVVQEGCLRIMERAPATLAGQEFRRYFRRTLLNLCLNLLEHRRRAARALVSPELVPDRESRPEAFAEGRETAAIVEEALDTLPPRQRVAVVMRAREQLEYDEIAVLLDVSPHNAAMLVCRGLGRLRSALEGRLSP